MKKTVKSKELWPGHIASARLIQSELREKILIRPLKKSQLYVAGVDAAFEGACQKKGYEKLIRSPVQSNHQSS